mgnify:CR=1 FL=1|tara:strand:+ start:3768 stop:5150 length:1383 start_codon:yes stop_codon:yes gene_type:complete
MVLFFNLSKYICKSNGVHVKFHDPVLKSYLNADIQFNKNWNAYYKVIYDKVKKKYILTFNKIDKMDLKVPVIRYDSDDGINFKYNKKNPLFIVTKDSCNFSQFIDENPNIPDNETYKSVFGSHVLNVGIKKYFTDKQYNNLPLIGKEMMLSPEFYSSLHLNGIYALLSKDGYTWDYKSKLPIISAYHPGALDGCFIKPIFDSIPWCFYDSNKKSYICYFRYNIKKGIRSIQYATSKDMINWSELKEINFIPEFNKTKDNVYFSGFYHYEDNEYIGICPFYKVGSHITQCNLYYSNDAIAWNKVSSLFVNKKPISNWVINGHIIYSPDKSQLYIYVWNFELHSVKSGGTFCLYTFRKDGFSSIVGEKDGHILTKNFRFKKDNYLIINFIGKLKLKLFKNDNKDDNEDDMEVEDGVISKDLEGDYLDLKVYFEINEKDIFKLKIIFNDDCSLYSINNIEFVE